MSKFITIALLVFFVSLIVLGQDNESRPLFSVYVNGVCGYIDKRGKIVIRPRFRLCSSFSEGRASVTLRNKKLGFIDVTGKLIIKAKFDWLFNGPFSEGYAAIALGDKRGYVDLSGKVKLLGGYSYVGTFSEGLAKFERDKLYGYIDKNFNVVIAPRFKYAGSFADGLAKVQDKQGSEYYIDKTGRMAINLDGSEFSEGLAFIKVDNNYGFFDTTGKIVISPQFEDAGFFYEGLGAVRMKGKWGFIDRTGQIVIEPTFDEVDRFFSDGLAPVSIENKHGYINKNGKIVIDLIYDNTDWFYGGLGGIEVEDKWGYIDASGKIIWQPSE